MQFCTDRNSLITNDFAICSIVHSIIQHVSLHSDCTVCIDYLAFLHLSFPRSLTPLSDHLIHQWDRNPLSVEGFSALHISHRLYPNLS